MTGAEADAEHPVYVARALRVGRALGGLGGIVDSPRGRARRSRQATRVGNAALALPVFGRRTKLRVTD